MRVLYLVTACSAFVVGYADPLVVSGQASATSPARSTFPRVNRTVAHSDTPSVPLSKDHVDGGDRAARADEERFKFPWMQVDNSVLEDLQLEWIARATNFDEAFDQISRKGLLDADERALRFLLEHAKDLRWPNDQEALHADHQAVVTKLRSYWPLGKVAKELVKALPHESVKDDVIAMLRIVADALPASSVAMPKKMEELKVTVEDAFKIFDLSRSGALDYHPGAAIQWLRRVMLRSKKSAAELTKKVINDEGMTWRKKRQAAVSNKKEADAFSANRAAKLLFKDKNYREVDNFLQKVEKIPDMEEFATTMRQHMPKEQEYMSR